MHKVSGISGIQAIKVDPDRVPDKSDVDTSLELLQASSRIIFNALQSSNDNVPKYEIEG